MFIARCVLFSHAQIECTSYGLRWLQCGCPETHIAIFLIESLSGNRLNLVHTIRLCAATRFVLSVPGDACKYWSSVTLIMHEPNHYFISVERRMLGHTHTHTGVIQSMHKSTDACLINLFHLHFGTQNSCISTKSVLFRERWCSGTIIAFVGSPTNNTHSTCQMWPALCFLSNWTHRNRELWKGSWASVQPPLR